MKLLTEVQASIESNYSNGRPLSQLQSARSTSYDPSQGNVSSIFVVDCPTFKKMSPSVVQEIFRHRHILVQGVETDEVAFDLAGLASLGSISLPRFMQGMQIFSKMNSF
jgi:hypothetical protein